MPLKKINNNYWQKRMKKFMEYHQAGKGNDFDKFSKLEYKDVYNDAVNGLKTKNSKSSWKMLKKLSNYNSNA